MDKDDVKDLIRKYELLKDMAARDEQGNPDCPERYRGMQKAFEIVLGDLHEMLDAESRSGV